MALASRRLSGYYRIGLRSQPALSGNQRIGLRSPPADGEVIDTSFPGFVGMMNQLGAKIAAMEDAG